MGKINCRGSRLDSATMLRTAAVVRSLRGRSLITPLPQKCGQTAGFDVRNLQPARTILPTRYARSSALPPSAGATLRRLENRLAGFGEGVPPLRGEAG
jgi:hypothetical protein